MADETKTGQTEAEWWAEDAERLNKMAKDAHAAGQAQCGPLAPPPLKPDGSLQGPDKVEGKNP